MPNNKLEIGAATRLGATSNQTELGQALTRLSLALGCKPKVAKTGTREAYTWVSRAKCYDVCLAYDPATGILDLKIKLVSQSSYNVNYVFEASSVSYAKLRRSVFEAMGAQRSAFLSLKADIDCINSLWFGLEENF